MSSASFSEWSHLQVLAAPSVISEIAPKEMIAVGDRLLTVYDRRVVSEMIEHYMSLGCEEDRHAWVVQKQRDMQAIEQHACQCETWQTVKLERHARELQNMRDDRLQSILTRLEATGLSGEARCILSGRSNFEEASTLIKLCSLNKAKSLTNQGWDGMESALVRMLSEHKRRRVQHEDRKDLRVPFPSVGDLLTDPILEAMIWDTPTAEELTPAWMRTRIMDELPRILYAWRRTQDERLLQILQGSRNGATLSDLCLATTIFGCTLCSARMIYPQVFYHRCCYKNRASDSRSHERLREMNELYDTVAQDGPWSSRSLFIHHSSSRLVERIIVGSGLDPSTTTTTDLTTAHPLIESESHPDGVPPGRLFVTWAGALTRILATQDGVLRGNRFGGESSTIRAKEPRDVFAVIHCAHCYKETTFYELSGHLSSVHDVHAISATSTVTEIHHHFNAHWYWSVLDDLNVIGRSFYYYPSTLC
ncbi:hypothetical protein FB446DRAFT_795398 [Lentinula raphanica]|nr:hypothetical protein FB446DRAFT_795398 [Lentinula raphanica]